MALVFGLLGLIVGSFLNVLVLRRGVAPVTGRSACPACGKILAWRDLVPVLSWLALRGRARCCGARISLQYPLVEFATGAFFFLIGAASIPVLAQLLALPVAALFIAIAAYDFRTMLIPNAWVYTLGGFALVSSLLPLMSPGFFEDALWVVAGGPATALPLFALWFVSRGAWMGFGDVKLALAIGWLLGPLEGIGALFLAFILGGIASAPLLFLSTPLWKSIRARFSPTASSSILGLGFTMKSEVPFGPFLIAAASIVWLSHLNGFALFDLVDAALL